MAEFRKEEETADWKRWLLRIGTGAFLLFLLLRIRYAAGGLLKVPAEIGERTYRTGEEQAALFLLCLVLFLLFALILSVSLALSALFQEKRSVRSVLLALTLFFFYVYACLYGYPLLDNHITTAWLMTGRYTETLILSILKLLAGVFGKGFSWDESFAWRLISGMLLSCPFLLLSAFVGMRNTLPVLIGALLPVFCFLTGEYCLFSGPQLMLAGALSAVLSAAILEFFTDSELLGSEETAKKGKPLWHIEVNDKRRGILLIVLALLWAFTIFSGRIRSFGAVMRLIFASSVYSYQKNLYDLADMRIAQAMLVSYTLSLCVRFVLSKVEVQDESRAAGFISAMYMLLLQIWVMPVLSNLLGRAADHAQGALPGDLVKETAKYYSETATEFVRGLYGRSLVLGLLAALILLVLCLAAAAFLIRLPAVRLFVWFLVYFSACTFVYCLIGLYYRSPLGNYSLLAVCYVLNYMLNKLFASGKTLRKKIKRSREGEAS